MRGQQPRQWYSIRNGTADEAELFIYDEISWWGVSAQQFVKDLNAITAKTIHLRINSPGGGVFDGIAIYNAIRRHSANVISHIDGLAASIASIIALAGNEVLIAEGAFLMIHNAHAIAIGDADEMRRVAELLDKANQSLIDIYVKKSGKTEARVRDWMADETWFTAEEAKTAGLVDVIEDGEAAEAAFDLGIFKHVPDQIAARVRSGRRNTQIETIRDLESFLRDEGGFSHAAAKKIAARGFSALSALRDEDGAGQQLDYQAAAELAACFRASTTTRS